MKKCPKCNEIAKRSDLFLQDILKRLDEHIWLLQPKKEIIPQISSDFDEVEFRNAIVLPEVEEIRNFIDRLHRKNIITRIKDNQ